MPRSAARANFTGVASRLAAFVVERFPLALPHLLDTIDAVSGERVPEELSESPLLLLKYAVCGRRRQEARRHRRHDRKHRQMDVEYRAGARDVSNDRPQRGGQAQKERDARNGRHGADRRHEGGYGDAED